MWNLKNMSIRSVAVLTLLSLHPVSANDVLQPSAPDPGISQVLGLPSSFCGHVIHLLMTNQMRQQSGYAGSELLNAPPFFFRNSTTAGDIELLAVQLVADGNPQQGPVFQLSLRNNSTYSIEGIRISIVGVLGQIQVHSPTSTSTCPKMDSNAVAVLQLQLPATSMSMSSGGQSVSPFETLVVAIDSFDELIEINELNNVQILKRADILPVTPVAASMATISAPPVVQPPGSAATGPEASPGSPAAPQGPQPQGQPSGGPAPGSSNVEQPTPSENIDLDKLDLGTASETALHFQ
jgi:hypothetical protein